MCIYVCVYIGEEGSVSNTMEMVAYSNGGCGEEMTDDGGVYGGKRECWWRQQRVEVVVIVTGVAGS